jgi:hypothetical protein
MNARISTTIAALLCLGTVNNALADCGDHSLQDLQRTYANGQKLERAGDTAAAFETYIAAQAYTCDTNPVEAPAAQRAAVLALILGGAAEKQGNHEKAFDFYEQGGQYKAADRVLMAWVRANPDVPRIFIKVRDVLDYRTMPSFQSNNEVRLRVTGTYQPDPKNLAEVLAMPAKGAERAFQKEAAAFSEEYLRGYVQQVQSRPDDQTNFAATQAWMNSQQGFLQKWPNDPLKTSLKALDLVHAWSAATSDQALGEILAAQRNQRLEQRAAALTKDYSGAPKLLDTAKTYQLSVHTDEAVKKTRVAAIKAQALKLGDAANARQRYSLAAEYYSVAGEEAKAQAARDTEQKLAMSKMQPQIDQMKQQAEQLQKEFSDPAKVQAMKEQALATQKSMQQQQQANAKTNAKKADDLEKELGL